MRGADAQEQHFTAEKGGRDGGFLPPGAEEEQVRGWYIMLTGIAYYKRCTVRVQYTLQEYLIQLKLPVSCFITV